MMRKYILFLLIVMLTSMLGGCILTKTPSSDNVTMSYGTEKTFSVKVIGDQENDADPLESATCLHAEDDHENTKLHQEHGLQDRVIAKKPDRVVVFIEFRQVGQLLAPLRGQGFTGAGFAPHFSKKFDAPPETRYHG